MITDSTQRLSLTGHHALVCGASKGIGRATAELLAARGALVTLLARSAEALEALQRDIEKNGGTARRVTADLGDREALSGVVDALIGEPLTIDILINNTGGPPGGPLLEAPVEAIEAALAQHLFAAHVLVGKLLPGMRESGYGRIINILSTSVREPIPNLGVSNLTRAAMASWAKSVSVELPPGITINNILPGFTDTDRLGALCHATAERTERSPDAVMADWLAQIPEGRLADPAETAEAVAFLASPAAAYVRGHSLPVDGGRLRSI